MSSQKKELMESFAKVFPALVSEGEISNEQHDQLKKIFVSYFETKKGQKYRAASVIGIISIIVAAFTIVDPATVRGLFDNPALAITLIGVLSLIVSLVVFSLSWYLRDSKSQSAMGMDAIRTNLKEIKTIVGEPTFTNLLNGLPLAAREEIIFPEPVGVLRHKEFRRALTISVALTYFAILGFSITSNTNIATNNIDNPITQAFAWVFVAVIAFYFGDKIFENYAKSKGVQTAANVLEPITIEEAKISKAEKKLTVKIKNNLKSKIKVTKILVDGKSVNGFKAFEIEAEKSIPKTYDIQPSGKTVKVEVGQVAAEKEIKTEEGPGNNETTEAG